MRAHRPGSITLLLVAVLALPSTLSAQRRFRAPPAPHPAEPLHFQYLGPPNGGRVAAIAGIPGDTMTYFVGAASGGVWKTTDGGRTFAPTFDKEDVQAIGALAVSPSDTMQVWAGTGEAWAIRDADVMGDGIYKSVDGGETWKNMGLAGTGRIGTIVVHPTNPNVVYVCALGTTVGPQKERGVFETTDGGETWKRVLFVAPNTGCSGLSMDAHDPNTLFAGMWQVTMHTWVEDDGGPNSGVYVTHDGGKRWRHLTNGLPEAPLGKIDVAVAPSASDRVYALIETHDQGSLWRSDDGGKKWRVVSWDRTLIGRAGYYVRIRVDPTNENEVLVANSSFHRSTDGGLTFPITDRGCGDCHDIWMDPANGDHWAVTGDGGASFTTDHGERFTRFSLPIGQMYHVAVDRQVPYRVYSNRQDDGTMRGPSNEPVDVTDVPSYQPARARSRGRFGRFGFGRRRPSQWQSGLGGCESGFTLPDVDDPNVVWASCYGNTVTRWDARTGFARSVSPWMHTLDSPPDSVEYRCHWTPPLAIDPFDTKTVYYGCQVVFRTSDGGQSWQVISPDLSTHDPSRIVFSGGITGDNLGQFYGEVVFAIAPSTIQKGLIWAGTNDGRLWYTPDGGGTWHDVTKNVGMPPWGTIREIQPSPFDPATAYVAVDDHLMNDFGPYIYETTDMGKTWTKISGDLPSGGPLDYVMAVTENPNEKGMLFAGTGHGFYYSMDDGRQWTHFRGGLPAAPVSWIVVEPRYHDVVVSTYGRGLWVLRDITRLEQAAQAPPVGTATYLYEPHDGFRLARSGTADFLYDVGPGQAGHATLDILDAQDSVIRSEKLLTVAGLNTATWNLRYTGPAQPALRTPAPGDPYIFSEPRFKGDSTRPVVHWGIEGPQHTGPLAAPGTYTARLIVDGRSYERPFQVLEDPAIRASAPDLRASTAAQIRINDDLDRTVGMIDHLEILRKRIDDQIAANRKHSSVRKALEALGEKAYDVELMLLSRPSMQSDDKWYVNSYHVYLNLAWLSGEVGSGAGDVAGGADHRPTDASMQVLELIERHLAAATTAYDDFVGEALPAFNERMSGKVPALSIGM